MISLYRWNSESKSAKRSELTELPIPLAAEVPANEVWWLDLEDPTPEEEDLVFKKFMPIHPLSLEDVNKPRREPNGRAHFPKVEEFHDYLFVIANPLRGEFLKQVESGSSLPSRHATYTQLSAIMTERVLITHHCEPLESVKAVRGYLDRHNDACQRGPDFLFHLILDAMVDEYAPVVDHLADNLDLIETRMFKRIDEKLLPKLIRLKRRIVALRKTLILEREVLMRLTRGEFALIGEREIAYYRNVYDHLVRYTELVEGGREMISDLLQSYLAAMSNRLNRIMKVLAMISTIVLPMTLIAGIYGMNFHDGMPELDWKYGYPFALGLMAVTGITSLAFFRWKKWF